MPVDNFFKYKCLNYPIKRHRGTEWIKNQTHLDTPYKRLTIRPKDTYNLKKKGWKNIFHANKWKQKQSWVAILRQTRL